MTYHKNASPKTTFSVPALLIACHAAKTGADARIAIDQRDVKINGETLKRKHYDVDYTTIDTWPRLELERTDRAHVLVDVPQVLKRYELERRSAAADAMWDRSVNRDNNLSL